MLRTKMFRYHLNAKKMKSKESVHCRIQKALDSMAFGNGTKTTILFSIYTIQICSTETQNSKEIQSEKFNIL